MAHALALQQFDLAARGARPVLGALLTPTPVTGVAHAAAQGRAALGAAPAHLVHGLGVAAVSGTGVAPTAHALAIRPADRTA